MGKLKKQIIRDDDPYKEIKVVLKDFFTHEITYQVNRMVMKVLIWFIVVIIPVGITLTIADYNRSITIKNIETNWKENDSIIKYIGKEGYRINIDRGKYNEACRQIDILKDSKADKTFVNDALLSIKDELKRQREFEKEVLKRQDIMLNYILELKNK